MTINKVSSDEVQYIDGSVANNSYYVDGHLILRNSSSINGLTGQGTVNIEDHTLTLRDTTFNGTIIGSGAVTFADDASIGGIQGTPTIDLDAHSLQLGSDASSNNNPITITGSGLITKTGGGSYILDTANHTGGIDIQGGAITLTAGAHHSALDLSDEPGTTLTVDCNPTDSVTFDTLRGDGGTLIILKGSVTIGHADEFNGSIYLQSGSFSGTKNSKTTTTSKSGPVDL